jgi:hypothetical protein
VIDQDLPHDPGGDGEEVDAVAELKRHAARKPKICLGDQLYRPERVVLALRPQVRYRPARSSS